MREFLIIGKFQDALDFFRIASNKDFYSVGDIMKNIPLNERCVFKISQIEEIEAIPLVFNNNKLKEVLQKYIYVYVYSNLNGEFIPKILLEEDSLFMTILFEGRSNSYKNGG